MDNKTLLQLERLGDLPGKIRNTFLERITASLQELVTLQHERNALLRKSLVMQGKALGIDAHRVSMMHDLRNDIAIREAANEQDE